MNLFTQVITDANDIYIYFEVIRQLNPVSVLDVGMMLKRMGAVSRQSMNCEISRDIRLDGIDFDPDVYLPVYKQIYSDIFSVDIDQFPNVIYDLAVVLAVKKNIPTVMLDRIARHGKQVLFDADQPVCRDYFVGRYECQALQIEGRTYGLAALI